MDTKVNGKLICYGCMNEMESEGRCPSCGFDLDTYENDAHHLVPGCLLHERYIVGRVLGEGGFGITYIGWDQSLEIKVAIKEYYPAGLVTREVNSTNKGTVSIYSGSKESDYKTGLKKFLDETRRLAKFRNNSGIVGVADFFEENGTAYMIMDYVDGITLNTYIKEKGGKISVDQTVKMLLPVIKSLGEIHKENIIHRDISPDNIMVQKNGDVRLIDFGAARDYAEENKSLSVVLKPGYAPEEQYRTKGIQGPWTDVYALCATMYKMITGITPEESMERIVGAELKRPSELGIDISQDVEEAIVWGMAVKSENRIQSMADVLRVLHGEEPQDEIVFHTGNQVQVGQKTEYIENNVDFDAVQRKGALQPPSSKKSFKKIGVVILVCIAIGIMGVIFWIGIRGGNGLNENSEAEVTMSPQEEQYVQANKYKEQGEYEKASAIYQKLADYKDSKNQYNETMYLYANDLSGKGDYQNAAQIYGSISTYNDAAVKREECIYQQALGLYQKKKYKESLAMLDGIPTYEKTGELSEKCKTVISHQKTYSKAKKLYDKGEYEKSKATLKEIKSYKPAAKLLKKVNIKIKNMPPGIPDVGEFFDSTNYAAGGDGTMWTVQWDSVKGASGYQYHCAQSIQGLDEEPYYEEQDTTKCYYEVGASDSLVVEFKVRAYKYINGTKKYGNWSRTVYCYVN